MISLKTMFFTKILADYVIILTYVGLSSGLVVDGSTGENALSQLEEKYVALEQDLALLKLEMLGLQSCSTEFCDMHWAKWGAWGFWSQCNGQCTSGVSNREQTRTRVRACLHSSPETAAKLCTGNSTEYDRRPCNTVELYGCLRGENTNSSDTHYGISYNFFDELAQSTCTAALPSAAHAAAVRRNCYSGKAMECTQICANLGYQCFDELHVYKPNLLKPNPVYQTDEGRVGLSMYRYFTCTFGTGGCGPNYCCCKY